MQITTEQAERVLKASILKARELGVSVCIAILDSGGHLTIGKPEGRLNPKEMIAKMVEVIPSREGKFLNIFPPSSEDWVKSYQQQLYDRTI